MAHWDKDTDYLHNYLFHVKKVGHSMQNDNFLHIQ